MEEKYEEAIIAIAIATAVIVGLIAFQPWRAPRKPKPKPGQGTISVSTTPTGAKVYVGGTYIGTAPVSTNVDPGTYTVQAVYQGESKAKTVTVRKGQTSNVSFNFKAPAPTAGTSAVKIRDSNWNRIGKLQFKNGGDVRYYTGKEYRTLASDFWQPGQVYKVKWDINFNSDQVTIAINGQTLGTVNFWESADGYTHFLVTGNNNNVVFVDDIQAGNVLVDDFEDGSVADWTGDTQYFAASSQAISESYSGKLDAPTYAAVETQFQESQGDLTYKVKIESK